MTPAEIAGLLGGLAGIITAIGGILAGIVKIRQERAETDWKIRQGKRDARRLAAEETQNAIQGISAANEELRKHLAAQNKEHQRQLSAMQDRHQRQQAALQEQHQREQKELSQRITNQGSQITDLTTRMTDIQRRHQAAIGHIVDRERAIVVSWGKRPESVPVVPEDLVPDLLEADPSLRLISHEKPTRPPPPDRRIRDPTDETED